MVVNANPETRPRGKVRGRIEWISTVTVNQSKE
jgi:hypothetical protein